MKITFNRWISCCILFLAGLSFASCTVTIEVLRTDIELDELEMKFDDDGSPTFKISPVELERTGVRVGLGSKEREKERMVRGYVQMYAETFDEDYDGYGLGGGVSGEPRIHTFQEEIHLILPYRGGLNFSSVNADENTVLGNLKSDIFYVELEADFGIGVDIYGAQPSVGFYVSSIAGIGNYELGPLDDDFTLSGGNAGAYIGVQYKHEGFPVCGQARALFGNVEGYMLSLGVVF